MRLLFGIILCFLLTSSYAQEMNYSRVKVFTGADGLARMAAAGIAVDHGECKKDTWFISDFSETEIAIINSLGLGYEIVIADVRQHYLSQNEQPSHSARSASASCGPAASYVPPAGFTYGSMAGFFTYAELMAHLDSMQARFPGLISLKAPAGNTLTVEGRPIYWVRISDNAFVDEVEPEMLYTSLHHAREPASASQLIYYMYYLLENYSTNPEIQYLVNNTELYFIPCVNPDGYIYNETTSPMGGGMWRKNRLANGDGSFGVDLNRNYGYNWGYDNAGSSNITAAETYRGINPFSEPETQIIRDFVNAHQFRITLNYHAFGDYLLYPWGYGASTFTPDSALFVDYATLLTRENHYKTGTCDQTLGYILNGSADDWFYGEQSSKPKIFSMTPETGDGSFGFWPPQSEILPICQQNVRQNLNAAHLLLQYAEVEDLQLGYLPQSGFLKFKLEQLGLVATGSYTVSIIPLSAYMTNIGAPRVISAPQLLQEVLDSISFSLSTSTPVGQPIQYVIQVDNGMYTWSDTITRRYGTGAIVLSNNGNSIAGWQANGWGVDNAHYWSPSNSISDSPFNVYTNSAYADITSGPINLTTSVSALLRFKARWEIEKRFDFAQVQASTDGGNTWIPLCGRYTSLGSGYQDFDNPLYDGVQLSWVDEEINLDAFVGSTIQIRFRFLSDMGNQFDGFYFDDLMIEVLDSAAIGINESTASLGDLVSQTAPNPADDYTLISYSSGENSELHIYNLWGEIVYKQEAPSGANVLNVNTAMLAPGMYYYRFVQENRTSACFRLSVVH